MKGWITTAFWVSITAAVFIPAANAQTAKAVLSGTSPEWTISGELILKETGEGLHISGTLHGVPAGLHGFHIHEYGDCSDQGKAAGDHFNPFHAPHGYLPEDGFEAAHAGDFGNVEAGRDGTVSVDLKVPELSLHGHPFGVLGRAFILHEDPDDFTQPLGAAGARIACGPIVLVKD